VCGGRCTAGDRARRARRDLDRPRLALHRGSRVRCAALRLAKSHGITVVNSPGTIDADYRGPVTILLINHGHEAVTIEPRQRIAQLVIAPVVQAALVEVEELDATARGAGGFGSTGR